jgi:transcriptional regulator with XRE-family HTH domain
MQENIEFAIGKPVGLDEDFRNAEALMYGKGENGLRKTEEKVKNIALLTKNTGLDIQEFNDLLYALHAQERNRYIRIASTDIGESITELRKKEGLTIKEAAELLGIQIEDYRKIEDNTIEKGITQEELGKILNLYDLSLYDFFYQGAIVKNGSGMTDAAAQEILSKYGVKNLYDPSVSELSVAVSAAVKAVHSLIADTRETMLDSGLESLDTIYVFEKTYKNYVPLQGFADANAEIYAPEILEGGRKLEVRGRVKGAKGRSTKADNPLTQAIMQNTNTIIRATKNEVMQRLYNLAKASPNKDVWEVIDPEFDKQYKLDKKNGKILQVAKTISDYMSDPSIVSVRIDGQYKFIEFTDDRMAETLRGATIPTTSAIIRFLGSYNRLLSSLITKYNLEFVVNNFIRDIQGAIVNTYAEQELDDGLVKGEEIVGKTVIGVFPSIFAIFKVESGKGATTEYEKYYNDFVEDGAKTAWFFSKGTQEIEKEIQDLIRSKQGSVNKAKAAGKLAIDLVERVNSSVENGVRLSSYIESRKAGISREKSAEFAKNLTVNFNKSGEWGTVANALYLFFNASIQGASRFVRTLKPRSKVNADGTRSLQVTKAQKIIGGLTIFGALLSIINKAIGDDDENGESFYSKIPDFEKERNIIIMKPNGKGYFKIPLLWGQNTFFVIGSSVAEVAQGDLKPGKAVTNIIKTAISSFSPISFAESDDPMKSIAKTFSPTILQIPTHLLINENYFGRTIYNTNFPFDPTPKPESELVRENDSNLAALAKLLNSATGGSEFRSGWADINPDKAGYALDVFSGGAGRFISRSTNVVASAAAGKLGDLKPNDWPFLRSVYGEVSGYKDLNDYYKKRVLVNQLEKEARGGITPKKEINTILRMQGVNKSVASNLRRYKKLEDNAMRIKDPDKKEAYMLKIDKMRYAEIARFQKAYEKFNIDDIK